MAAVILDGKAAAAELRAELAERCAALAARGVIPCLAVILVGEDPASQIYVRNKKRACEQAGVRFIEILMPTDTEQAVLDQKILALNADPEVDGILVQSPLPEGLDERRVLALIDPKKDVDGFHVSNMGALATGGRGIVPGTPEGCMELIRRAGVTLDGKEAVVVGRSNLAGKPMALLLLQANATVTVCHSRTKNLAEHTRRADVLVVAIRQPKMITGGMVKPGAIVIDIGINRLENRKVVGDVDFDSAREVAGYLTPVPGGVGPMTIAMLLKHTIAAAEARA
ncbi:MAG: bifunctional methylenetetrahydrofolate dehydrogenase/methenyltetrahydrofolate cyclohydrolase FolD [Firmicutes bacterium]|nr:bifunctional methylenetetrahydrofolate dehydrogenase/methenyltetrahydrofolate cyclohydrolase FolD [Bacillota bacterium]